MQKAMRLVGLVVLTLIGCARPSMAEPSPGSETRVWLDSLDLTKLSQRRGAPRAGKSIRDLPITLGGVVHEHGIGTGSISEFVIDLGDGATRFEALVGLDDVVRTGVGSVTFDVWADDRHVAGSGLMRPGDAPRKLTADLAGARVLTLLV